MANTTSSTVTTSALGAQVDNAPLTTTLAAEASPELLRNAIDQRIVKIRPMSTPLDQISRYGGSRLCGSMKVEYYSVDTKPTEANLNATVTTVIDDDDQATASADLKAGIVEIKTSADHIFQPSTTIMVPSVKLSDGQLLVLYVLSNTPGEGIRVKGVNSKLFTINRLAKLVRMGRAAAELDVQTSQFEALPVKANNFCQIFKAQVEQSTLMKIANKEVGWTFTDQEEAAVIDMRMGMEKNFLFGSKCRLDNPDKGTEVLLTDGIWNQTSNTFNYTTLSDATLVSLCRKAFANSAGSSRKVLLAGSGLIEKLHNIDHTRVIDSSRAVTKWGLDFTEIHSKFGTLYVMLSETFDNCLMPDGGMVIDPEYITKYCHVPFRTERLDLRAAGIRNTDAIVITEASCLVLRYPQSHLRIVKD